MVIKKPILIYDGECTFCLFWIKRWRNLIGNKIDYAPFQRVAQHFSSVPTKKFHESVILIKLNGQMLSGARAVFESLAYGGRRYWLWFYKNVPGFAFFSESLYRCVAKSRSFYCLNILILSIVLIMLCLAAIFFVVIVS